MADERVTGRQGLLPLRLLRALATFQLKSELGKRAEVSQDQGCLCVLAFISPLVLSDFSHSLLLRVHFSLPALGLVSPHPFRVSLSYLSLSHPKVTCSTEILVHQ